MVFDKVLLILASNQRRERHRMQDSVGHNNDGSVVREAAVNRPNERVVEGLQSGRVLSARFGVQPIPLHQAGKICVTHWRVDEILSTSREHPNQQPIVERCVVQNNDTGRQDLQDDGWSHRHGGSLSINRLEQSSSTRLFGESEGTVRIVAVGLKTNHLGEKIPGLLEE